MYSSSDISWKEIHTPQISYNLGTSPLFLSRENFAFTLSQSSISCIPGFLNLQERDYPEDRNFLVFLDEIISEFPELFEPKQVNAVKTWLQGKERVLMEPAGTVFHLSENISDNRQDILLAWDTFKKDTDIQRHFREKYIRKKAWYDYYKVKGDIEKVKRAALSMELDKVFLSEEFESLVQRIESKPFDIYPLAILFVEKVNLIATNDTECFNPINQKVKAYLERRSAHLHNSIRKGNLEAMSSFYRDWVGEPLKSTDADFPFFFVYALRQQKPFRLFQFLDHQLSICERPLEPLLAEVCEDYAELLTQETIDRIKKWTQERAEKLSDQKQSLEAKPDPLPDGYKLIDTGLTQEEVKECFAFLHEVKDDDGNSFLSKADYDEVFRYGLAIPKGDVHNPTIRLYLDQSEFSLAVILHFVNQFAKFIEQGKSRSFSSLRGALAKFLFASFQDFYTPYANKAQSEGLKAIRKRINNQKDIPSRSRLTYVESPLPVFRVEEGG